MEGLGELSVPCLKLEDLLHAAMNHIINHESYSDAIFLGERICANFPSETATKLLAKSFAAKVQARGLATGTKPEALGVLLKYRTANSCPINRYLHAKLLFDDGKLSDAEAALSEGLAGAPFDESNVTQQYGESAAFVFALSAAICERTGRFDEAMRFSSTALRLNPFLWSTFRVICRLSHRKKCEDDHETEEDSPEKVTQSESVESSVLQASTVRSVPHVDMYDELIDSLRNAVCAVQEEQSAAHLSDAKALMRWPLTLDLAPRAGESLPPHRLVMALPFAYGASAEPSGRAAQSAACVFGTDGLLQSPAATAAYWRCLVTELVQPRAEKGDDGAQLPSKRRAVAPQHSPPQTQNPAECVPCPVEKEPVPQLLPPPALPVNASKKQPTRKPRVESSASEEPSGSAPVRTIVTRAATMRNANVKENKLQPGPASASSVATRLRTVAGPSTIAASTAPNSQQTNVPAKRTKPNRSMQDKEGSRHVPSAPVLRSGRVITSRRDGPDRESAVSEGTVCVSQAPVAKAAIGDVTNTPPVCASRSVAVAVAVSVPVVNSSLGSKHLFTGNSDAPAGQSAPPPSGSSSPTALATTTRRSNRTRTGLNSPGSSAVRDSSSMSPQQSTIASSQTHESQEAWPPRPADNDDCCTIAGNTASDCDPRTPHTRLTQLQTAWTRALDAEASKLDAFCAVLKTMAKAYGALNAFRCADAHALLGKLPAAERRSRFALKRTALAHFEAREFARACIAFEHMRREFPFSVSGLDTYSTALWYVQKGAALSALAQQLLGSHPHAPQTWITLANCFSLQRDAERTLTFLERSLRLKERAYTHALVGHELLNQGESVRARNAFSRAVELDPRCYSALFGLGMLHLRADELAQAERCMRLAMRVTPFNSIVVCHLGVILHAQRRYDDALTLLRSAIELNPRDTMSRFHYASILFSLARYEAARVELENVKQVVPNEPIVFYLLSKVYRKLQRVELAQLHVTWALDLDPKRSRRDLQEVCKKQFLFAGVGERDEGAHTHGEADSDDSEAELLAAAPAASGSLLHAPLRLGSLLNQTETSASLANHSAIGNASASASASGAEQSLTNADASSSVLATSLSLFPFPLPTSSTFHLSMSASTSPTPNETDSDA